MNFFYYIKFNDSTFTIYISYELDIIGGELNIDTNNKVFNLK